MAAVWSGSVATDDPTIALNDITLWSSDPHAKCPLAQNAKLRFLSLVHVQSIPLYLAAAPSLGVYSDKAATEGWMNQCLVRDEKEDASPEAWWRTLRGQSEEGILLRVEDQGAEGGRRNEITEILLYAAVVGENAALPTPPVSSPPATAGDDTSSGCERAPMIGVYALPLSSRIITGLCDEVSAARPSLDNTDPQAALFLPDLQTQTEAVRKAQEKRQNLTSLFDDATQKKKKLKGRGGERVAHTMASLDRPASQPGTSAQSLNESQRLPHLPAQGTASRRGLSRASTMSSVPSEYSRPVSRAGPLTNGKRSSLHRVESAISPRDSPTLSDADDNFGNQNKIALTKIVMAGMRLYGLQQTKKASKDLVSQGPSTAATSRKVSTVEKESDDEYKLVYHQTYKAAAFAFRKQFSSQLIPQETLRDVVDRFLSLFCTDPMASTASTNNDGDLLGFGTQGSQGSGAFDLPSGKASSPNNSTNWSTPRAKKA